MVAGRKDVQLDRDASTLQGKVHDRVVFRVGASDALTVVVDQEI